MEKLFVNQNDTFGILQLSDEQEIKNLGMYSPNLLIAALEMLTKMGCSNISIKIGEHKGITMLLLVPNRGMVVGRNICVGVAPLE